MKLGAGTKTPASFLDAEQKTFILNSSQLRWWVLSLSFSS
jgi:hypothetical protein